jgi:hypothetical protein
MVTRTIFKSMAHKATIMPNLDNPFLMRINQSVHILIRSCYHIIISVTSYMFRAPTVAIFREVFIEGILYRTLKQFTNIKS